MTNNEINVTATCIAALANQPNSEEKIKLLLTSLFTSNKKTNFNEQKNTDSSVSSKLIFTQKEISKMATTFKKVFIANGLAAHVIKKKSGKNSFCYEIRYRANGYNIVASSTDLQKAKEKFLAKTAPSQIGKYLSKRHKKQTNLLEDIFEEWYQYKKGTITEITLNRFQYHFSSLPETLRKQPISSIRTGDLDKIMKEVKPRKYEELRTLFNGIFKYAIASGILTNNPVALIKFKRAERQSRDALSENEIETFLMRLELPEFEPIKQGAYLLYFFGLRPCEVDEETHREGDFLIARNRKRKNGKIEYKKIPIPNEAEDLIDWNKSFVFNCPRITRDRLLKNCLVTAIKLLTVCVILSVQNANNMYVKTSLISGWVIPRKA